MRKLYFLVTVFSLTTLVASAVKPDKTSSRKIKNVVHTSVAQKVEIVPRGDGSSYILHALVNTVKPISFMVTDARGVVVMFGDNYSNGAVLDFAHFRSGNYTIYFDKDTNSAYTRFTVSK